jgi:hypothetical protein
VALGLCRQTELDAAVQQAVKKKAAAGVVMSDDERRKLVSTEQSLGMTPEPKIPASTAGVDAPADDREESAADFSDAESFFNLPHGDDDDDEADAAGIR